MNSAPKQFIFDRWLPNELNLNVGTLPQEQLFSTLYESIGCLRVSFELKNIQSYFLQNDIYLNKNHQFWTNLSSQKPQLLTNITKIVNITINVDSFTLKTIVRDLAHNILLAIKRNNTSFTLFLIVSCSQHMRFTFKNVFKDIIVTKKCPLFFNIKYVG